MTNSTQDTKDPDMVERVALKPCPYCGTAPIIIAGIIGCPECASGQPNAERWNRRFEASHHAELVGMLTETREHVSVASWTAMNSQTDQLLERIDSFLAKIGGDA